MRRTRIAAIGGLLVIALLTGVQVGAAGDSGGTTRWSESYLAGAPAWSSDVATSPDGSTVFVTGTTQWSPMGRLTTLAYDASTGDRRWVRALGSTDDTAQGTGYAISVSPDGSQVFVAGESCADCATTIHNWTAIAYDATTGDRMWVRRIPHDLYVRDMTVSPDGATIFVGSADGRTGAIRALDARTGAVRWTLNQPGFNDYSGTMVVSPDSATLYFGANRHQHPASCDRDGEFRVFAYDVSDGSVRWSSLEVDPTEQVCGVVGSLALSADGGTLVGTGTVAPQGNDYGLYPVVMVVYDAFTGALRRVVPFDDMAMNGGDVHTSVAITGDGSTAIVLGSNNRQPAVTPMVATAVDLASGDRKWTSSYDSGGMVNPVGMGLSSDDTTAFVSGDAYVRCGGDCGGESSSDAPVVAYDVNSGEELWVSHHRGDSVSAMAVGPGSSGVFLAGTFAAADYSVRARELSRAAGCDSYCGFSTSATNIRGGRATIQESDGATTLGGWRTRYAADALSGSYRSSRTAGDAVTFRTPAVTAVTWVTRTGGAMGRARVLIDGRDQGVIDLYTPSPSRKTITFDGLAKHAHTVSIRVLGRQSPASAGARVSIDAFKVRTGLRVREESSAAMRYGSWSAVRRSAASGGQVRTSANPRARIALTFSGRSVRWVTATGPGLGKARVAVDGVGRTVNLYSARRHWKVPIAFTDLTRGEHRIAVRPLGRKDARSSSATIVVDAFSVRP